ncbi:hypothetical protein LINPERPRIM_LOCUS25837 [Linum perenne]
MRLLFQSLQ